MKKTTVMIWSNWKSRSHKLHMIETNMDIIRRSESSESFASVGYLYNISLGIPLSLRIIQAKALSLHEDLKKL